MKKYLPLSSLLLAGTLFFVSSPLAAAAATPLPTQESSLLAYRGGVYRGPAGGGGAVYRGPGGGGGAVYRGPGGGGAAVYKGPGGATDVIYRQPSWGGTTIYRGAGGGVGGAFYR